MSRLPAYPAYKDSGVPWLGQIPQHWEVWKIKHGFRIIGSGTTPPSDDEKWYVNGTISWVQTSELREKTIYTTEKYVTESTLSTYPTLRIYPNNSILIALYGATIGRLGILGVNACTNQACCALAISSVMDSKFVFYWLWGFKDRIVGLASGGTQPNISQDKIRNLRLALPPLPEQRAIAAWLDEQTQRLDALTDKLKRLLEKLAEQRAALITRAVTHGLNPDAPLKDSGIPWLGQIPTHWEVRPLFSVLRERQHKNIGRRESNLLSLSYGRIIRKDINSSFGLLPESFDTYQIVQPGNIILRLTDLQNDKHSLRTGIVKETGIITSAYLCLEEKRNDLDPEFAHLLLHSYDITKIFYNLGAGVRQTMKFEDLKRLPVLLPPLPEQRAIAAWLDEETKRLDEFKSKIESALERLSEYRSALITAAVTGQIDVRNHARPE